RMSIRYRLRFFGQNLSAASRTREIRCSKSIPTAPPASTIQITCPDCDLYSRNAEDNRPLFRTGTQRVGVRGSAAHRGSDGQGQRLTLQPSSWNWRYSASAIGAELPKRATAS